MSIPHSIASGLLVCAVLCACSSAPLFVPANESQFLSPSGSIDEGGVQRVMDGLDRFLSREGSIEAVRALVDLPSNAKCISGDAEGGTFDASCIEAQEGCSVTGRIRYMFSDMRCSVSWDVIRTCGGEKESIRAVAHEVGGVMCLDFLEVRGDTQWRTEGCARRDGSASVPGGRGGNVVFERWESAPVEGRFLFFFVEADGSVVVDCAASRSGFTPGAGVTDCRLSGVAGE